MLEAKRRAAIFLLLAFLLAATAGYLVLEKVKQLNAELGGMVEIYVANQNIQSRTLLQPSSFSKMEIPQKFKTDSHITSESQIRGKVSVVPLSEGDMITDNMLKDYANLQNENNRLVGLYRTDKIYFDQEVAPMDRVDIVVSYDKDGEKVTEVFMKDVLVTYTQGTGENFAGGAVEVSAKDAPKLIHMENYAEYIRVLKANVGVNDQPTEPTTEQPEVKEEAEKVEQPAENAPPPEQPKPPADGAATDAESQKTTDGNS